jgi:hypothetical protein
LARFSQMMMEQAQEQELIDKLEANPWDIEVRPRPAELACAQE